MRFGICSKAQRAGELRSAGADFVEENIQAFLQGFIADAEWQGMEVARASALPILAANSLVPADLKIVGPSVDFEKLRGYIGKVVARAQKVGMKILVFGSGAARNVPEGFDRERAQTQIVAFCRMAAELAGGRGSRSWPSRSIAGRATSSTRLPKRCTYVKVGESPEFSVSRWTATISGWRTSRWNRWRRRWPGSDTFTWRTRTGALPPAKAGRRIIARFSGAEAGEISGARFPSRPWDSMILRRSGNA